MPTFSITLPEPLQKFVLGQSTKLGLEPDRYFEKLVEEEQRKKIDDYYEKKVAEAINADQWTTVQEENWDGFWNNVRQKAKQLQETRSTESVR